MNVEKKIFIRDGRAPIPERETTSKLMSAIKNKNTGPEQLLRFALNSEGIRGYRLHLKNVPGRPDISFLGKKIAIFVNGCFWHRCPNCNLPLPKSNTDFWTKKFAANQERDNRKLMELENLGWNVITVWECQLKSEIENCMKKIKLHLKIV